MKLLLYISERASGGSVFRLKAAAAADGAEVEETGSPESLARRLRRPGQAPDLTVALPGDLDELEALSGMADLFSATRLVLIAPGQGEEALRPAHRLHPRFLSFDDGDYSEVTAVLAHIVARERQAAAGAEEKRAHAGR